MDLSAQNKAKTAIPTKEIIDQNQDEGIWKLFFWKIVWEKILMKSQKSFGYCKSI